MKIGIRRAVVTALITLPALGIALLAEGRGISRRSPAADVQIPTRRFSFTYRVTVPGIPEAKENLHLWIPAPHSDAYQQITGLEIQSPAGHVFRRDDFYHNEYAYFDVPASLLQKGLVVTMEIQATRREHRVELGGTPAQPADPLTPAERKRYLAADRLVPLNGVIGEMSAEQTKGLATPLEKARAIYNYVIATMKYEKTGEGWGRGDAAWFCTAKKGNCTDFHGMFIGMARAAGIPAKFEIGFPLPGDAGGGTIGGYHCWAEFYVAEYGWIPVDASEAWKHPEKRDYFFGAHDVNRVQFTTGRDLELAPKQAGDPVNYAVYPYAELGGKVFNGFKTECAFRDVP
jgi:transglutaminase-like putative cysteine protease